MTENPANPTVPPPAGAPVEIPECPACGERYLYNRQEIEEGREYRIVGRDPFPVYELDRVNWTIYVENWLVCAECGWEVEMDSDEASRVLD